MRVKTQSVWWISLTTVIEGSLAFSVRVERERERERGRGRERAVMKRTLQVLKLTF